MAAQDSGIKCFRPQAILQRTPRATRILAAPIKRQPTAGQKLASGKQQQQQSDPDEREHRRTKDERQPGPTLFPDTTNLAVDPEKSL